MKINRTAIFIVVFLTLGCLTLQATEYLDVKVRFFEGARKGKIEPRAAVTSSFLNPTFSATIPSKFLLADEKDQIKRVFNLKEVNLITESDLSFTGEKGKWKTKMKTQRFQLNGQSFFFILVPEEVKYPYSSIGKNVVHTLQFRIVVYEKAEETKHALLDTQFFLPEKNLAVFGFEDKKGNPYFMSFQIARFKGAAPPPPPPPPPPPDRKYKDFATKEEIAEFTKGAVPIEGELKPPKLIKRVDPIYPEKARKAKVDGIVILGIRTDIYGRVKAAKIYRSKSPILNKAAVAAVKQWVYEPLLIDGKPREALFTVTVVFKLKDKPVGKYEKPKLIKRVDPIYPKELRKQGIQGIVILEVTTDIYGVPKKVEVLKSENSLLNQSAIDAVKQWVYEPDVKEGKPVPGVFTVTVRYKLK
jgi:TonB family protein